jgi:hypothetical protein
MSDYYSIHEELKAKAPPALEPEWVEYHMAIVDFIEAARRYRNAAAMKEELVEEYDAAMNDFDAAWRDTQAKPVKPLLVHRPLWYVRAARNTEWTVPKSVRVCPRPIVSCVPTCQHLTWMTDTHAEGCFPPRRRSDSLRRSH